MAFFPLQQVIAEGDQLQFKLARVGSLVKLSCGVILCHRSCLSPALGAEAVQCHL